LGASFCAQLGRLRLQYGRRSTGRPLGRASSSSSCWPILANFVAERRPGSWRQTLALASGFQRRQPDSSLAAASIPVNSFPLSLVARLACEISVQFEGSEPLGEEELRRWRLLLLQLSLLILARE